MGRAVHEARTGSSRAARLGGAGLLVAGLLLGPGLAVAQGAGEGALACYQLAERQVSLSSREALLLCRGAVSAAPAECYAAARTPEFLLSSEDAIDLCRCSTSLAPVRCYERADDETFLDTWEILRLCSPSVAQGLLADCRPSATPLYPWRVPPY